MKKIISLGCLLCSITIQAAPLFLTHPRFHAIRGLHGVVTAQEQLAADVGRDMLKQGGNAVDAAVATGFALMITLPRAGALGGGGFMTIWNQKKHKAWVIDYRESAPAKLREALFLNNQGKVSRFKATHTGLAVGVPGTVAGLVYAEQHFGRLGLSRVMKPAIQLATQGIKVTQSLAQALRGSQKTLQIDSITLKIFSHQGGGLIKQSDRLYRPHLAQTLLMISKQGKQAFYQGPVARAFIHTIKQYHGVMTLQDLKQYKVVIRQPLSLKFQGYTVLVPPSPSSGVTLFTLLKMSMLFPLSPQHIAQNTAKEFHVLTEMMNFAFYDRNHFLADPQFFKVPIKRLLSKQHIESMVKQISLTQHLPSIKISRKPSVSHEGVNTTQFSVVDRQGNMVSNTYSLNYYFGSGITVPRYGIILNNTMDDFTIGKGVSNAYGLIQGQANRIEPGKRPLSSMTPVIVLYHHHAWLATGTPGGSRIITSIFQLLINMIDYHLDLATATQRPRIHSQLFPDHIFYEQGISDDTLVLLKKMGHQLKPSRTQGSLQSVLQTDEGQLFGFADSRRLGAGVASY